MIVMRLSSYQTISPSVLRKQLMPGQNQQVGGATVGIELMPNASHDLECSHASSM